MHGQQNPPHPKTPSVTAHPAGHPHYSPTPTPVSILAHPRRFFSGMIPAPEPLPPPPPQNSAASGTRAGRKSRAGKISPEEGEAARPPARRAGQQRARAGGAR